MGLVLSFKPSLTEGYHSPLSRCRITTPSGEVIWVEVLECGYGKVRLDFTANLPVKIWRETVLLRQGEKADCGS